MKKLIQKSAAKNKIGKTLRITKKSFKMKNYRMNYFQQLVKKLK